MEVASTCYCSKLYSLLLGVGGITPILAMDDDPEIDFLAMFDDCMDLELGADDGNAQGSIVPTAFEGALVALVPDPAPVDLASSLSTAGSSQLVAADQTVFDVIIPKRNKPNISGRKNGKAMSWYRHWCKAHKKIRTDEMSVLDALVALQRKTKTGKKSVTYNLKRLKRRNGKEKIQKNSLVLQAKMKTTTSGNRFVRQFSMMDFLETAFGEQDMKKKFLSPSHIATHFNISEGTVRMMRTTVAASVMAKQVLVAVRIFQLCKKQQPVTIAVRHAWDETAQDINVCLLGSAASRSAWKVMVQKVSMVIFWETTSLCFDLVTRFEKCFVFFFFYETNCWKSRLHKVWRQDV